MRTCRVYLGVATLDVCEVFKYIRDVRVVQKRCIFYGLVDMCKAEGVELYWTRTGKIMAAVCLSAKLVSYRI